MENNGEPPNDKKSASRAKSSSPPSRLRNARRTMNANEAVKSLDLALTNLKIRSGVANSGGLNTSQSGPLRPLEHAVNNTVDVSISDFPCSTTVIDNTSLMSMNFSHYELIRNLSRSTNSEGAFSDTTNKSVANPMDLRMKREQLERYFRSAEMWRYARSVYNSNSVHMDIPEK